MFKLMVKVITILRFYLHILKVTQSRIKPGVAQRVPGGLGSQIS